MKTINPQEPSTNDHASWLPLLDLAAREVFEIMLGTRLEAAPENGTPENLDFTAMVGLAGQICGVLTVRCSAHSAVQMASKMLGFEPEGMDNQIYDAIGEVSNMIAGNFKNKLTGIADKCLLSVPTVITGSDYSCRTLADEGSLELPLSFEGQMVVISLELHT